MARRRRRNSASSNEALARATIPIFVLVALAIGGIQGFVPVLVYILIGSGVLAVIGGLVWVLIIRKRRLPRGDSATPPPIPTSARSQALAPAFADRKHHPVRVVWTAADVQEALNHIDWFQFEKFCEALLRAEGFQVERKGGAHPDGGVDLVVSQNGLSALIQCKHWKAWQVQEKVVRELLGSMTHFGVGQAAIFCLKGATEPAKAFAAQHDIDIVDAQELGKRAVAMLGTATLNQILDFNQKRCPKCEAPMVRRDGKIGAFWGCSRYPQCRGKLELANAA